MTVMVDHEPLATRDLGLQTLGHVLSHLQKDNRLVVQVLIDGQAPPPGELNGLRQTNLEGRTIFIETADPRELSLQVLEEVASQLRQSGPAYGEAAELFARNQANRALEKLSGCLRVWQDAEESVSKVAQLLRLDLELIEVEGRSLREAMQEFAEQLKQIRSTLEHRDYVSLSDILIYETGDITRRWIAAVGAVGESVRQLR